MGHLKATAPVRVLGPADAPAAADVLTRAFDREPAKVALLPDSEIRQTVLELSITGRLHDALRYGNVHGAHIDGELGAVALWYPPGVPLLSPATAARVALGWLANSLRLARAFPHICRMLFSDLRGAMTLMRERRPAVARATQGVTWRLDLLGTVPEHQRKGLARLLLERQLRRCDQDGAAVWLEATDPANPPVYERFGFESIACINGPTWLPGYWVMRREPPAG
jgi:GNAT superfamily N-acetyltransferase